MKSEYTRKEVAEFLGVSGRTIQVWVDNNLLRIEDKGHGKGFKRKYSTYDVFIAIIIKKFRDYGAPTLFIDNVLLEIDDAVKEMVRWVEEHG